MSQPPVPGRGLGEEPARDWPLPGGSSGAPVWGRDGDLRLGDFTQGGAGDTCPPGPGLAAAVDALSGPQGRYDGASDDELVGLLGRWAALESWAAGGKLGAVRELIRRRARPGLRGQGMPMHGDLPDAWEEGLGHEVAAELAVSLRAADSLAGLAWDLQARLPGIGALLAAGTISATKARMISDELAVLDDEHAAQAEALIIDQLAGKTPGQIGTLAARAACTVDPDGARKRRERAERDEARVRFWRDHTGASALAAYGLPTDEALAANANVTGRAEVYKKSRAFPGARMDQLRVLAFLDLINGVTADARIARARAGTPQGQAAQDDASPHGTGTTGLGSDNGIGSDGFAGDDHMRGETEGDERDADDSDGDGTDDADSRGDGGHDDGTGGNGPDGGAGPGGQRAGGPALPASTNLTIPLATLLGLAERPGQAHGLGPLDPALAGGLAATAAASPHSRWCVTVTDASGVAIGHGCAGPTRTKRANPPPPGSRDGPWAFTRRDGPGPPDGYGTWALTLPGGRELTVHLGPVPVTVCDHRHESHGYQPNDTLRHLVEIRDGECTFPPCSRHARGCDFEHAIPHDQGGRTCACNGAARSRRCHRVKQSKGWNVTQPRPGRHQWTTPAGRTYTQGPMRYPA